MTDRPALLKQIFTEARPYVEQLVELNVVFTGFRKLATDNGLDWGQIKALLRAEIEDGDAGSEKVDRIIKKAEFAGEYAALLGLGTSNMNERNSISETIPLYRASLPAHDEQTGPDNSWAQLEQINPETGEITEPASAPSEAAAGQEDGVERPGGDEPTLQASSVAPPPEPAASPNAALGPAVEPTVPAGPPPFELPDIPECLRRRVA